MNGVAGECFVRRVMGHDCHGVVDVVDDESMATTIKLTRMHVSRLCNWGERGEERGVAVLCAVLAPPVVCLSSMRLCPSSAPWFAPAAYAAMWSQGGGVFSDCFSFAIQLDFIYSAVLPPHTTRPDIKDEE